MDILYSALFYILGAIILVSTVLAVTRRNQVHAVVYLIVSFFGTALLFYLLGAPLPAALEVIIYAGAIMVLFIFIIMTTVSAGESVPRRLAARRWILPAILGLISLGAMSVLLLGMPVSEVKLKPATVSPADFGRFLFERYWLPVEIISFLLFVALVGALYLGREERRTQPDRQKDKP